MIKKLRERWKKEDINYLSTIFRSPGKNQPMRTFPFDEMKERYGTFEDRIDFRGFPLHQFVEYQAENIDFSFAKSPDNPYGMDSLLFLHSCILTNCYFKKVAVIHNFSGTIIDCDFTGAKFNKGGTSGQYHRCCFDNCNFSYGILGGDLFEQCTFRKTNFRGATFSPDRLLCCVFEDCTFTNSGYAGEDLNNLNTEDLDIRFTLKGEIEYKKAN